MRTILLFWICVVLVLTSSTPAFSAGDCCFTVDVDGDGDLDCINAGAAACAAAGGMHFATHSCDAGGDMCTQKETGAGGLDCFEGPEGTICDNGDLVLNGFACLSNGDGTFDIEIDFFDNLNAPTIIEIAVEVNEEIASFLLLTCSDVAGDVNTCTGPQDGPCSGVCPRRQYAEFPGNTFQGDCKLPPLGLQLCRCRNYKIQRGLGLQLSLESGDDVTVTLDPNDHYIEVSESNNALTVGGCAAVIPTVSEWGLIVMTLLALTAGTIVFARRRRPTLA